MFGNYIKIALRSLKKNMLYAMINVFGLGLGLTVYLFGGLVADYERNHDTMFKNHERIYTVGSILSPNASIGVNKLNNTYTAMGPLLATGLESAEAVARTVRRSYLVSVGDNHFNERVRFADKELTQIFDFTYVAGNAEALTDPKGVVLTEEKAMKYFGRTDVLGETIMLNHEHDLRVTAVIKALPKNSHFISVFIGGGDFDIIAPLEALNRFDGWALEGNWHNLSGGNYIYVMTKEPVEKAFLNQQVNAIFDQHVDPEMKENFLTSLDVSHLQEANTGIWDMVGMPVIESVQVLGLLVLVIAIVNYTNLATAQSMGRAREVGMRKTLGAGRPQLMMQFLTESVTIALLAMVVALVALEIAVPAFNTAANKVVALDYLSLLPWLFVTTLVVGIVSGLYPALLITKTSPIAALKDLNQKGAKGGFFRSLMIGVQFMISIFMLATVMIIMTQNKKVKDASNIFPKEEVLTLSRMNKQDIRDREEVLRRELLAVPYVQSVTFASQVPFEQSNNGRTVTPTEGDRNSEIGVNVINADPYFLETFDIKLLAGRGLSPDNSADYRATEEDRTNNVLINELMATRLGFKTPAEALGKSIYGRELDDGTRGFRYDIIGVVETQNILGLHNEIKPWMFSNNFDTRYYGGIRVAKGAPASVITDVEAAWKRAIPDYPIEHGTLTDLFQDVYAIYENMSLALAMFSTLALMLALIGLFGLAAFMARGRTKEIGIRKVMGANIGQLVKMMMWQFSKPVYWALLTACPLAYFASNMYLQFFAERITIQIPIILIAGAVAIGFALSVIAVHAIKVARSNPILALRYE